MKCELIHNNESERLILIFAGWSTDPSFYSHIDHRGYDVMVAYDYSDLSFPMDMLDKYHTVCLFAWSLGVMAAAVSLPFNRISLAVAVNGTETPVDDNFGIPVSIFNGTLSTLNERNLKKFRRRMAGKDYEQLKERFPSIDITLLQNQLSSVRDYDATPATSFWNRVYISENDAIFPAANQHKAWERHHSHPEIVSIDSSHYVSLDEIIKSVIPEKVIVGKRFQQALSSYSEQALAQKEIASRLLGYIPAKEINRAAEIGPGSGVFSHMFAERFHPETIDYVDLYELPVFNLCKHELYHTCDAEEWMRNMAKTSAGQYDAIVSASAMQWFANPADFIKNASAMLRSGGIFAASTFLPGNLPELSGVNPFGLIYRSEEEISDMIAPYFRTFSLYHDSITLEFDSPRHLLTHLRNTGVGGTSSSNLPLRELLSRIPSSLTYLPLYLIAEK